MDSIRGYLGHDSAEGRRVWVDRRIAIIGHSHVAKHVLVMSGRVLWASAGTDVRDVFHLVAHKVGGLSQSSLQPLDD